METHDFPQDTKARRFCLTLMGEARLCYETLRPIQIDWDAFKEHFQQQYSKFGSTREQYFHVWRSFHFDENVDTIDSYINWVKQVVALLNYGEPQILELFKNTLPSRLYCMLYQINDLRTIIETAKRVLTKEKLDKQKAGQSSMSPFMKASQEYSKRNSEKGVSFGALETIDRHSDSMDKLASLVSKLDLKLDKWETQYRPQVYQAKNRECRQRQDSYRSRDRSYSRDHGQYNYRGRRNYNNNNNRNYRDNSRSRNRNSYGNGYRRNDRHDSRPNYRGNNGFDNRQHYRRDNYRQDNWDQRYRNRSVSQDRGRSRPRYRSNSCENSYSRNRYSNNRDQSRSRDRRQRSRTNSRDRDNSRTRSRSSSHVSTNRDRPRCYRCNEYVHFARECPNALTDDSSDELEGATLQMLTQEESPVLNYTEMEDLNM